MTGRNTITMTQRTPTTTRRMTCLSKAASGLGCLTMFGLASTASATATGFSFETSLVDQSGWSSTDPRTLVSVKVYIDFDDELDRLVIVNGKPGFNLALSTDDAAGFFHSANASSDTSDSRTSAAIAVFPSAEADSYVSIGLLNNDSGTDAVITTGMDWATFNGGGPLQVLDTDQGGGWLVTPDDDQGDATDGHVFIGQFTVASGSAISGTLNYMYIDNATETNIEVDGATISAFANPVSTGGKSDFNGDGQDDVLWQCDDAASAYDTSVLAWLNWDGTDGGYDSDVLWNSDALGVDIPASWEIQGSGDLDGDGDADILWRGSAGETLVWSLDGEVGDYDSTVMYAAGISGWEVRAIGDFNDDGQDDVLWQCTDAGSDYYTSVLAWINWDGTDEGYTSVVLWNSDALGVDIPASWQIQGSGDFDGDGRDGILWRGSAGEALVWSLDDEAGNYTSTVMYAAGISGWEIRAIGDFNDDGQDDVLWQCTDAGSDYYTSVLAWINWDGTDGGYASVVLWNSDALGVDIPASWQIQGSGDFDGDGRDGILWRGSSGEALVWSLDDEAGNYTSTVMYAAGILGWEVRAPRDIFSD